MSRLFLESLAVQGVQDKSNLLRFLSPEGEAIVANQWTTNGKPLVRGDAIYDALIYNWVPQQNLWVKPAWHEPLPRVCECAAGRP
jgi:hypothetical protein